MGTLEKSVFISYARELSQAHARMVFLDLRAHGFDVFMQTGPEDQATPDTMLSNQIAARAHVVVILTPGIQDLWKKTDSSIRREIALALDLERHIVPVLTGGFRFETWGGALPNALAQLSTLETVNLHYETLDLALETLREQHLSTSFEGTLRPLSATEAADVQRMIDELANRPAPTRVDLGVEECFARAYLHRAAGALEEALATYTEAIELDDQHYKAYYNRGLIHYDNHSLSLAEEDFTEAIRLNPDYAKAYYNRGLVRYDRQDMVGAVSDFSDAVRLDPSLAAAYNNRGLARKALNDLQSAAADFSAAIRADARQVSAYYNRAIVRQALDDLPGAVSDYQKFLELGGGEAYHNRAEIEALISALQLAARPVDDRSPLAQRLGMVLIMLLAVLVLLLLVTKGSLAAVLIGIAAAGLAAWLHTVIAAQHRAPGPDLLRRLLNTSRTGRSLSSPVLAVTSPFDAGQERMVSKIELDNLVDLAMSNAVDFSQVVMDLTAVKQPPPTPAMMSTRPLPSLESVLGPTDQSLVMAHASDIGKRRDNNQDAVLTFHCSSVSSYDLAGFGLCIVADGMGGHLDGEKASAMAVQTIAQQVIDDIYIPILQRTMDDPDRPPIVDLLRNPVQKANRLIYESMPEAGTTVTAAAIMGSMAYIAHVGDSRAYLITQHQIDRITRDHSLAERLVELGQLTPEEADGHTQAHVLYRAVGQADEIEVDTLIRRLVPGSYLLLCSDGLWGQVPREVIHSTVLENDDPQVACDRLISLANGAGGPDNITAVLVKVM